MSPTIRLVLRALIAGVLAFASSIQAAGTDSLNSGDWINAAIAAVLAAGLLGGAEFATPLNPTVGLGKPAVVFEPEGGVGK